VLSVCIIIWLHRQVENQVEVHGNWANKHRRPGLKEGNLIHGFVCRKEYIYEIRRQEQQNTSPEEDLCTTVRFWSLGKAIRCEESVRHEGRGGLWTAEADS
jgi:hypothetical protein